MAETVEVRRVGGFGQARRVVMTSDVVRMYAAIMLGACALYFVSCAPGALWQDSGLIQYRIWHNDIKGFLGLAISHPLFYIIGIAVKYAVPFGSFCSNVNLISAVAGAIAVANVFLFVRLWVGEALPAVIAAVMLAVSHTFWQHASIIETYTLWSAFFTAELILLLLYVQSRQVRFLYVLALFNGLAISVHMLASIPLVCYAVYIGINFTRREIKAKEIAITLLCWVAGAAVFEYLIIREIFISGDLFGTLASAAFGARWKGAVLNTKLTARIIKENFLFMGLNFPTPNILLLLIGIISIWKMSINAIVRNFVIALMILFFVFAFRYTIEDRYSFFIPFYITAAIMIGVGAQRIKAAFKYKIIKRLVFVFAILPGAVYAIAPSTAQKMEINIGTRGDIPYRDDYKYFLQPWKTWYKGADEFACEVLEKVAEDAIIIADSSTVGPLLIAQEVNGLRSDVKIYSEIVTSKDMPELNEETIDDLYRDRVIYTVSRKKGYCPAFILERYDFIEAGIIWRMVARRPEGLGF